MEGMRFVIDSYCHARSLVLLVYFRQIGYPVVLTRVSRTLE